MGMGPLENAASAVEAAAAAAAAAAPSAGSYAVLQCGEDSEYVRKAYSGYFQVFRALLEEDGEAWRVYRAPRGELPTDAEAAGFDGFVISGSCADAHGDEPWILALVDLIRRLHAAGKRILGVCFGHQIMPPEHGRQACPRDEESSSPNLVTQKREFLHARKDWDSAQECHHLVRTNAFWKKMNPGGGRPSRQACGYRVVPVPSLVEEPEPELVLQDVSPTEYHKIGLRREHVRMLVDGDGDGDSCEDRTERALRSRVRTRLLNLTTNEVLVRSWCLQILCRALGGRTGRSTKGWDIGVSCIHPTAAAARLFAPLKLPVHMPVIEFHQDEVWELPPSAEVLARSDKTRVEMFRLGDRVMGVQGHPEYSKDILMSIADRLLQRDLILDCQVDVAKASFDVRQPDKELWKKVCRGFLKGRLPSQQHQLKQQAVAL
ncbi:putative glutamine amidotransferase-like protein C13C5.04 [Panicum miliaceum]|uniref:Glutamine amidotransferase-like protein C13C5.04 n=1 Tax=Panicum miliaceum TaxID=4540 RepID=A0A3L6TI89_PANMI|nr:putative glutamine amidotransferase-like protein C13C5.04 [Panicum miliaceum]